MQLIRSIVRGHKLEDVRRALDQLNVGGITVTQVLGRGRSKQPPVIYRGIEYSPLLPRMQIEVVVDPSVVDEAVTTIIGAARTGLVGDGMVFVSSVSDTYRIRTGDWEG